MTATATVDLPNLADAIELRVVAEPTSAAIARAFVREHATLDCIRHAEAALLVTELIGNVMKHSPDTDEIVISVHQDRARGLIVSVSHPYPAPLTSPTKGVGFMFLDRLTKDWGHHHDGESLVVWFVLRSPGTVTIPPEVSDIELVTRMAEDPAACSDELLRRHQDLATSIARRYRGRGVDDEDLLQVANMALVKAIQRYDPSLGMIRPFAAATISGELKRLLRDKGWSLRVPRPVKELSLQVVKTSEELAQRLNRPAEIAEIAAHLDVSESRVIEAMNALAAYATSSIDQPNSESAMALVELIRKDDMRLMMADDRVVVEQALAQLSEREQRILDLRFNEDMTQSEIAAELGISQMHVSRLLSAALNRLEHLIGTEGHQN